MESIKICDGFFNLVNELDSKYFPGVKYYRDDKNCEKVHYAVELFNNGALTYGNLIKKLSKSCKESQRNIHIIVKKYIKDFGDYRPSLEMQHPMLDPDYDSLNSFSLIKIQQQLKLNKKDFMLLMEAYRRKMMFHRDKVADNFIWLGLGTPSQYRSPYFAAHSKEIPRVNNWYVLTEEGLKMFNKIVKKFPFPNDTKTINLVNGLLFKFVKI